MANAQVALMAKAKKLGIDGYRRMSQDELRAAVESAQGTQVSAKPAKGKPKTASTNGASAPKEKTASTPAKSASKKSAPKATASKGTAKRSSVKKSTPAKGTAKKQTPANASAKKTKTATVKRGKKLTGRVSIDRSQIDWTAESNVGANGKRADVMKALRKYKGNYDKVFAALEANAKSYYPKKKEHEAKKTLRWLINRVAFDFAFKTGQHQSGTRAAYGTSTDPILVKRRAKTAAARKGAKTKTTSAKKTAAKKTTAKKTMARKGAAKKSSTAREGR